MISLTARQHFSFARVALYAVLASWAFFCVVPLYWLALASIKSVTDIDGAPRYLPFIDFVPVFSAWHFILFEPGKNLLSRFFNSSVISAASAIITLMVAVFSFYGMTRIRSRNIFMARYQSAMFLAVIALRLVPPALVALPSYLLATQIHIIDTHGLLIGIYSAFNFPLALLLILPVLRLHVSVEEESARLEGASHFRILADILLPMYRTQFASIGALLFLLCWNEYLFASYLTYDHAETLTPWMVGQLSLKEAQTGGGSEDIGHMAAATLFMAIPAFLLAFSLQKFIENIVGRSLEKSDQ